MAALSVGCCSPFATAWTTASNAWPASAAVGVVELPSRLRSGRRGGRSGCSVATGRRTRRGPVPAAVRDLELLSCAAGVPADRRLRRETSFALRPRPGRRGSVAPSRSPSRRSREPRTRVSGRRPAARVRRLRRAVDRLAVRARRVAAIPLIARSEITPDPDQIPVEPRELRALLARSRHRRQPAARRACRLRDDGRGSRDAERVLRRVPDGRVHDGEQGVPGVGGRDGVRRSRSRPRSACRAAVRVAALPLVGERVGVGAPAAVRDLQRLTRPSGDAVTVGCAGRDELGVRSRRPGRRGPRTPSSFPSCRSRAPRTRVSARRPWRPRCRSARSRRGSTCSARPAVSQRYHWYAYGSHPSRTTNPSAGECLPCWITTADKRAATDARRPGAGRRRSPCWPRRRSPTVAMLKTACEVAPERACTIATSAWPRSAAATACVSAVAPPIGTHGGRSVAARPLVAEATAARGSSGRGRPAACFP